MMTINSYSDLKALVEKETRSDSLFHITRNWVGVLKDGYLKGSYMNEIERKVLTKVMGDTGFNVERYISFGRSIESSAFISRSAKFENFAVVLEFDRLALKRKYRIVPVNYYANTDRELSARAAGRGEAEDRLMLPKGKANLPIKQYLVGVHILSNTIDRHKQIKRVIENRRKDLEAAKKEYNHAASKGDEYRLHDLSIYIETLERRIQVQIEELDNLEDGDYRRVMTIPKLAEDYPNIPFYVYAKHGDWIAKRFSEADQMNPNLPGYHDEEDDD